MSGDVFNLSSVCSANLEADMNGSLDGLDQTADDLCEMVNGDKIRMNMGFDSVNESLDIKRADNASLGSPDDNISPEENMDEQDINDDNASSSRKMKLKKENRKCTVCGDRALGYNFDAITCESCKAFFRRNANKSKHPKCMFQKNCNIDPNTRRFCSACRLSKCFAVGMKKEMILGDDERQKRVQKVQQNRAKKLVQLQKQTGIHDIVPSSEQHALDSPGYMDKLCQIKMERRATFSPCSGGDSTPWSIGVNPRPVIADLPVDSANSTRWVLGESDSRLIQFISTAYTNSFGSTAEEAPLLLETTSLEALMNHIGILVKILIRFAKRLSDFTSLPQNAQVALLKGSSLDCITWRSAQMFDREKGKWINDDGVEIPIQLLNAAFDQVDSDIQTEHITLISSIKELIGNDMTLISLVQCVILFTPEYSAPGTRALTSSVQDKYITLLKHYLQANNDWTEGFELYAKILSYMSATKSYTTKHSKAFLQCDASRVEPLLLEVFNLSF